METEGKFFGRIGELEVLQDAYDDGSAQMAIVYGRRRVGKTRLLEEFCKDKRTLFYTARNWPDSIQLSEFSAAMAAFSGQGGAVFSDWVSAIEAFARSEPERRKVLVIDEFQYIAQQRPSILSELQVAWDQVLSRLNIVLILCGSAVSFIAKEVLGQKNPLYGRAKIVMKVRPLSFRTTAEFFPSYCADDKFRAYAALGGIPYYLGGMQQDLSLAENLAFNVLRDNSFLHSEEQLILMQETRSSVSYNSILRAIAYGAAAHGEIAQKSCIDARIISKYLGVLQDMDLVEKELPVFAGSGDSGNVQRGIYRIADNFLKFWFRFVGSSSIALPTRSSALQDYRRRVEPNFASFASRAFEDACKEYLIGLGRSGRLPMHLSELGRWWHKDKEIDLVGADYERENCLVAECKYTSSPVKLEVLDLLEAKISALPLRPRAIVHRWLFSRSGFDPRLKDQAARDDKLHLVSLEDLLFEPTV